MADIFSAIAKFLTLSWRTGSAIALTAGLVWLSRFYGVPQVGDMPQEWFQGVMLVGLLGFSVVAVQGAVLLCQGVALVSRGIWRLVVALAFSRVRRAEALENLRCASQLDMFILLWLRAHGLQRFKDYPYERLQILRDSLLLQQLNGTGESTHWRVPDHIWSELPTMTHLGPQIIVSRPAGKPPWQMYFGGLSGQYLS